MKIPVTEIEQLSSKTVYQNPWMRVREDGIQRSDGSTGIYGVVEKPDFAVIAAIEAGKLYLVEQYRYPIGERCWELPQGSLEQSPDATPLEVAQTELLEETGLKANKMQHAGHLLQAPGYSNQGYHIFVASELTAGEQALGVEVQGLIVKAFNLSEVESMIVKGVIRDGTTVATLGLLRLRRLLG